MPIKTTTKATATTRDKGKGIQTMDTQGYVASNSNSPIFFSKKTKSLVKLLDSSGLILERNIDLE